MRIGETISECLQDMSQFDMLNVSDINEINEAKVDMPTLLISELENINDNTKLFIATYHMPCKFTKKTLMEANVLFCMKVINEIVGDFPVIFSGDFNSKCGENEWSMLAKGQFNSDFSKKIINLFPICSNHFNDALDNTNNENINANNNRTPTCYDQISKQMFCIDFIFYRNLLVKNSDTVTTNMPIPSNSYPSDHLFVAASFTKTTE